MYFKVSSAAPFLLKDWSLQSVDGLLAAVIVTVAMTVIRECLAYSLYAEEHIIGLQRKLILKNILTQARRAGLHMINTAFAYTLMLCVMTYNVWLLALVSLSAGFSYLFFRPLIERACMKSMMPSDHQPNIALITSNAVTQEYYVNSQKKLKRRDERRSFHELRASGNHELVVVSPPFADDQNHTENTGGVSGKPRANSLPSQTKAILKDFNRVEEMTNGEDKAL